MTAWGPPVGDTEAHGVARRVARELHLASAGLRPRFLRDAGPLWMRAASGGRVPAAMFNALSRGMAREAASEACNMAVRARAAAPGRPGSLQRRALRLIAVRRFRVAGDGGVEDLTMQAFSPCASSLVLRRGALEALMRHDPVVIDRHALMRLCGRGGASSARDLCAAAEAAMPVALALRAHAAAGALGPLCGAVAPAPGGALLGGLEPVHSLDMSERVGLAEGGWDVEVTRPPRLTQTAAALRTYVTEEMMDDAQARAVERLRRWSARSGADGRGPAEGAGDGLDGLFVHLAQEAAALFPDRSGGGAGRGLAGLDAAGLYRRLDSGAVRAGPGAVAERLMREMGGRG